jgi:hypothetical protein
MADLATPKTPESPGDAAAAEAERRELPRLRLTAIVGTIASALWLVAFFLPWIVLPPAQRDRVKRVLEPQIDELATRSPTDAENYRLLLNAAVEEGSLTGLDLYHYARSALSLNRTEQGEAPEMHRTERPWVVQRGFRAVAILLAALPLLSLAIFLHFPWSRFRAAGSGVLVSLVLAGFGGGALAITWLLFAEALQSEMLRGDGWRLGLLASVTQALAGLFGVTTKNWWRVYATSILLLGAIGSLAAFYVFRGLRP